MNLAGWRPHQKGQAARNQEWTPEEWHAFAVASQIYSRRPKRNRGTKRKQWWQDRQEGRDPNRRRREQQEGAENSAVPPIQVAAEPPADVPADAGLVAPTEAQAASNPAAAPVAAPPVPSVAKPAAMASFVPGPTAMVPAKARPQGPPLPRFHGATWGPRPAAVIPRPPSPFGDQPCFSFHFQSTTTTITVPKGVLQHMCSGYTFDESLQHMDALFNTPDAPKAFQYYQRPPAILVADDTSDEEYINPELHICQYPDDTSPNSGGSQSSKDPPR